MHLSKSIECAAPRVNCNVNWAMVMYQGRFLCFNKGTTLVRDVNNGGNWAYVGQGVYEKSLYLHVNLAMNLKLLQNTKVFKTNKQKNL